MTTDYGQAPPAPGWFPDPTFPGQERRWDGATWTDEVRESHRVQLIDPGQLASPDQLDAAILSAEAYSELVDLAPPTAGTAHPPTVEHMMRQAAKKYSPTPARRAVAAVLFIVGAALLLVALATLADVITAPPLLVPSLAIVGLVGILIGIVVRLGWPRF